MKENELRHSRRQFFGKILTAGLLVPAVQVLTACDNKNKNDSEMESAADQPVASCDDLTGVPDDHLAVRKKLGYVEKSPIADNQCQNCNLYLPPKPDHKCGGCMLFKGPVFADAYCTYWAPKV